MLFVLILYLLPFLTWLNPTLGAYGGTLHLERFNSFFVATIFFINGLTVGRSAFSKFKANITVFLLCFGVLPWIAYLFPKWGLSPPFAAGIVILSALPITAASCVSLTQMAGGDRNVPLFSAVATNLIGAILTPLLLTFFLESESLTLHPFQMMGKFSYLIIVPLLAGRLFSHFFPRVKKYPTQWLTQALLLLIVYAAFCTTFFQIQNLNVPSYEIALLFTLVLILHLVFIALAIGVSAILNFPREDRIAMIFTVPQKTIVAGIPLILALIATTPTLSVEEFAFFTLPLLIYNNLQWLTAGLMLLVVKR